MNRRGDTETRRRGDSTSGRFFSVSPRLRISASSPGLVLVMVMVITAFAAMVAASLLFYARAQVTAAAVSTHSQQAQSAVMSGIGRTIQLLRQTDSDGIQGVNDLELWADSPELFQNQLVLDDGAVKWYYSIYAPNPLDPKTPRFGLVDEASKININTANEAALLGLPNMTQALVDCLLDYRESGNSPRPQGAKQDYYDKLPHPYVIRNGPLLSVEELLLVRGFGGPIVYGVDANMNGILDPNECDGGQSFPPNSGDSSTLDMGMVGRATTFSYEPNVASDGSPRISLNGPADQIAKLKDVGLPDQTIKFIAAYRAGGNVFTDPSQLLDMKYTPKAAATQPSGATGTPDAPVEDVPSPANEDADAADPAAGGSGQEMSSGIGVEQLALVCDKLTARPDAKVPIAGLVNVNTASKEVLASLPGMTIALAQSIVDARGSLEPGTRSTIVWLKSQNVLDSTTFKVVAPFLTARSFQFRMKCVGFCVPAGRFKVVEAVVDLAGATPRILYMRDLTRLGLPFAIDVGNQTFSVKQ